MYKVRDLIKILEDAPKDHYVVYCHDDQNLPDQYLGSYRVNFYDGVFELITPIEKNKVETKTLLGSLNEMVKQQKVSYSENGSSFLDLVVTGYSWLDSDGVNYLPVDSFKFKPI